MFSVSDAYKIAIQDKARSFSWSGTITTVAGKEYSFTNAGIVKGSGYISRECSGSSEIELGSVYASELGISLFFNIDRYTLGNAKITLDFHLKLPDGSVETVPMGVFYVSEANRTIRVLELKAYDAMLNFDKAYDQKQSSGYPIDFLNAMCTDCHVELAQTQAEIEALPNGKELMGVYAENDIETWRDFLHYLSQALGCFALIDREGKLRLMRYGASPICTVDSRHRFSSSFSDFITRYTAINSTNKRTNTAEYYALDPDDGLTMNLGVNPLLQYGIDEVRERILTNILSAIAVIRYVPFDSDTIGDPALDPGDVLAFTGGQADASTMAAITSVTVRVNGKCSIKCVGKNPRLANVKSKNDKDITGLLNEVATTKMSTYFYMNAMGYTIGEEKTKIISIEYATQEETDCEFKAAILLGIKANIVERSADTKGTGTAILEVDPPEGGTEPIKKELPVKVDVPVAWEDDGQTVVSVIYVVDGHEVEYFHPMETLHSGAHILNLFYPLLDMEEKTLHTFEVWLSAAPGTAAIAAQFIIATITGQGLSAQDRWDGRIDASDEMPLVEFTGQPYIPFTEAVAASLLTPTPIGPADRIVQFGFTGMPFFTFVEQIGVNAPIVHDIIQVSDKGKMLYSREFVLDETRFELRRDFEIIGGTERSLDRGRMVSLTIPSDSFESLSGIVIHPFVTEPFINGNVLHAVSLLANHYTVQRDSSLVMKTEYSETIEGEDREIDRGRLRAYPLGLGVFERVSELEVQIG